MKPRDITRIIKSALNYEEGKITGVDYNAISQELNDLHTTELDKLVSSKMPDLSKVKAEAHSELLKELGFESKEAVTTAMENFKTQASKLEDLEAENTKHKNKQVLSDNKVKDKFHDFVLFEAQKLVDDKTDLNGAVESYLKENPEYAEGTKATGRQNQGNPNPGSSNPIADKYKNNPYYKG